MCLHIFALFREICGSYGPKDPYQPYPQRAEVTYFNMKPNLTVLPTAPLL
jgi:hypothetical protein